MKKIITISREFGSGGRELGQKLAEQLNIKFYDSEIINLLSKETGGSLDYISSITETGINNQISKYACSFSKNYNNNKLELLLKQEKIIKKLAEQESCVIVGRGADVILKDFNIFKIFVYSDLESKIKRCMQNQNIKENITEKEIIKKIKEIDKQRQKYYDLISNINWGDKQNYDLCINTSNKDINQIVNYLSLHLNSYYGENK